jgi:hypothetical protein
MSKAARPTAFRGKWRIGWLDHERKRRSAVFESYHEAEQELRRRQVEADDVRVGLRRPAPVDRSFGELCDYWLKHRAPAKRTEKDDAGIIRKHLRPAFGAKPLRQIGAPDMAKMLERTGGR